MGTYAMHRIYVYDEAGGKIPLESCKCFKDTSCGLDELKAVNGKIEKIGGLQYFLRDISRCHPELIIEVRLLMREYPPEAFFAHAGHVTYCVATIHWKNFKEAQQEGAVVSAAGGATLVEF